MVSGTMETVSLCEFVRGKMSSISLNKDLNIDEDNGSNMNGALGLCEVDVDDNADGNIRDTSTLTLKIDDDGSIVVGLESVQRAVCCLGQMDALGEEVVNSVMASANPRVDSRLRGLRELYLKFVQEWEQCVGELQSLSLLEDGDDDVVNCTSDAFTSGVFEDDSADDNSGRNESTWPSQDYFDDIGIDGVLIAESTDDVGINDDTGASTSESDSTSCSWEVTSLSSHTESISFVEEDLDVASVLDDTMPRLCEDEGLTDSSYEFVSLNKI